MCIILENIDVVYGDDDIPDVLMKAFVKPAQAEVTSCHYPLRHKCCGKPLVPGSTMCEEHNNPDDIERRKLFRDMIEEGHNRYEAGVRTGCFDPDY